jgi:hypothetical protein
MVSFAMTMITFLARPWQGLFSARLTVCAHHVQNLKNCIVPILSTAGERLCNPLLSSLKSRETESKTGGYLIPSALIELHVNFSVYCPFKIRARCSNYNWRISGLNYWWISPHTIHRFYASQAP